MLCTAAGLLLKSLSRAWPVRSSFVTMLDVLQKAGISAVERASKTVHLRVCRECPLEELDNT